MDVCNNSEFNNFFGQNRILRIFILSEKLYTSLEVERKYMDGVEHSDWK